MTSPDYQKMAEAEAAGIIRERQPLPVELLATDEQRRLADATRECLRPLPGSLAEELADDLRRQRVSVQEHQAFRESIARPCDHFDEIDLAMAIPDPPQKRSERESRRILEILDQLERGEG